MVRVHRGARPACLLTVLALAAACGSSSAGRADGPAMLVLEPKNYDFGTVVIGDDIEPVVFTLHNAGGRSADSLTIDFDPSDSAYGIESTSCGDALSGQASCTIAVLLHTFAKSGPHPASLLAQSGATRAAAPLSVELLKRPRLDASDTAVEFPITQPGAQSAPMGVQVCNLGESPTGPLSVEIAGERASSFRLLPDGCGPDGLAAQICCTASLYYAPEAVGEMVAELVVSAQPGGAVRVQLAGRTGYRLTVNVALGSGGVGRIISDPPGIDCPGTCTMLGSDIHLQAVVPNGSGVVFRGFEENLCWPEQGARCEVWLREDTEVGALFEDITTNLVFVSSELFPANLGGTAPYDAACNRLATSAGINNTAGNAFVAWMSDVNSSAVSRLGSARGFQRVDGAPFADDLASLLSDKIFNAPSMTEVGAILDSYATTEFWSGTNADGTVGEHCSNWTSNARSESATAGDATAGPGAWSDGWERRCDERLPIVCFMRTLSSPVPMVPTGGKRIFLSNAKMPAGGGIAAARQLCAASAPRGMYGVALPMLSLRQSLGSSVINWGATYVRPDGQVVGTGDDLIGGRQLRSGIWQSGDGTYVPGNMMKADFPDSPFVWSGSMLPNEAADEMSSCADLTDAESYAQPLIGWFATTHERMWWGNYFPARCQSAYRVYCVEQ